MGSTKGFVNRAKSGSMALAARRAQRAARAGLERRSPPRAGRRLATPKPGRVGVSEIEIERHPSHERLLELGVFDWPIWTKEISRFPWSYSSAETCFLLEGEVVVTPEAGAPVRIAKGDLVRFPRGLRCTWEVTAAVRKHYSFED